MFNVAFEAKDLVEGSVLLIRLFRPISGFVSTAGQLNPPLTLSGPVLTNASCAGRTLRQHEKKLFIWAALLSLVQQGCQTQDILERQSTQITL